MLRGMRKASSNWLGRIVMGVVLGLIAVSFAVWGIGDVFRGFGQSTVAKIGSTEISVNQFRQIYTDRLQQIGRQVGRPITPDQARMLRLEHQIVGQLVADAAIDQRAREMRLNVTDAEIARQITNDPTFKGPTGNFDRARFEQMLRSIGYNEARFAAERKRETVRRELVDTVIGGVAVPKSFEQALNRYENEQRAIDYVVLERAKAGDIAPPTPEEISSYYEGHKADFRTPEYRNVVVLSLTPAELARPAEVSDADVQRYYEANLTRFGTPERRQLQQIVFPTEEEARAALARLGNELSFEALAKERGMDEKDLDLGLVTKTGIIDRAVADAAFALQEGAISEPIKGTFGTTLVKVVKIEPDQVKKLEEVAAEIRQTIATDRARSEIATRHDKIEDERGAGNRLTEIAPKLGLTARVIEAVDRNGRDPEGNAVEGWPAGVNPISSAFTTDVGMDSEPLQVPGGGYLWVEVLGIKPARDRSLDEVRAQVEERWRNEQISKRLQAKATEMVEKLKAGTPFADVASAEGLTVQTTFGLRRGGTSNTIPAPTVEAVFQTEKKGFGSAEGASPTERIVFQLTDITVPEYNPASAGRVVELMRRQISEDLMAQYVQRLQNEIGVSINADALRRVAGGETN